MSTATVLAGVSNLTQGQIEGMIAELLGRAVGRSTNKAAAIARYERVRATHSASPATRHEPRTVPPVAPSAVERTRKKVVVSHPKLDSKRFLLLFDGSGPMIAKTKNFERLGLLILKRWLAGVKEGLIGKEVSGAEMRAFLEKDRAIHFPNCRRSEMIRVFQDYMTVYPKNGLAKRL